MSARRIVSAWLMTLVLVGCASSSKISQTDAAKIRVVYEEELVRGCQVLGTVADNALEDLQKKAARLGGNVVLLTPQRVPKGGSFWIHNGMIVDVYRCADALLLALTGPALAFTRAPVPGAVDPTITQANIPETICTRGWTATVRPPKEWSQALKVRLLAEQGLPGKVQDYELDHLISLGLGGAARDPANLWIQPWPEARAKDDDEANLRHAVCAGRLTLEQAQRRILEHWGPRP